MPSETYLANWNTYQAAWADIPAAGRQELLFESVDQDCVYTDPQSVSHGHEQLIQKMESTQRNFPGARFRNDKFTDHHEQAISNWTMFDGGGNPVFTGTSYARFGPDGRLTQMTGFFEPSS